MVIKQHNNNYNHHLARDA